MLRTCSVFARFKWFALGIALAGLAGCGGGGSSTAPGTAPGPQTIVMPTTPDFASAVDITGQGTVEGRIESAGDRVYYKIRIDEPSLLTLRVTGDVDITVYDSEGNVVEPLPTGQNSAAFMAGEAVAVAAVPLVYPIASAGTIYVAVTAAKAAAFVLSAGVAAYLVKKIADFTELRIGVDGEASLDLKSFFQGEKVLEASFTGSTFFSTKWGRLEFSVDTDGMVRGSHTRTTGLCGNGRETSLTFTPTVTWEWGQGGRSLSNSAEQPITIGWESAPRRKEGGSEEISVSVAEEGSETLVLTNFIEDPDGDDGRLTFAVSGTIPHGWGVTTDGTRMTFSATERAANSTMTVTATDSAGECWNFPVQVRVEEEEPGPAQPIPPDPDPTPPPITLTPPAPGSDDYIFCQAAIDSGGYNNRNECIADVCTNEIGRTPAGPGFPSLCNCCGVLR